MVGGIDFLVGAFVKVIALVGGFLLCVSIVRKCLIKNAIANIFHSFIIN